MYLCLFAKFEKKSSGVYISKALKMYFLCDKNKHFSFCSLFARDFELFVVVVFVDLFRSIYL